MKIAEKLKEIRKKSMLTQTEFAEKIGVNQATVGRYENGKIIPSLPVLIRISQEFNFEFAELLALHVVESKKYSVPNNLLNSTERKISSKDLSKFIQNRKLLNLGKNQKLEILREVEKIKKAAHDLIERISILEEKLRN